MHVLVVDDTPENVYMLEALLKGNDYEVSTAANGNEALGYLRQTQIDLIISDILMPKMDGFQLCRTVKADDGLKNIPFIFYTATYTSDNDKEFALSLGASRFILKPAEPEAFMTILREVIEENKRGLLKPSSPTLEKETEYLKEHQARLIKKLGDKITKLEQAEELYRSLISCAEDAIITLDKSGMIASWNKAASQIFHYESHEIIGKPFSFLISEESHAHQDVFSTGLKEKTLPERFETTGKLRQGELIPVEISLSLMKDKYGEILGCSAIIRNMTEQKRTVEKLRQSEELYRSVFENHSAVKLIIDPDNGNIVDANDAATSYYGWSRKQLQQMNIQQINGLSTEEVKQAMGEVLNKNRVHFEFCHRRADDSIRNVDVFSSKIPAAGKILLHSIVYDITDRKRAEAELRDAENRYRLLFDQSPDGMVIIDPETGRLLEFNESAYKQLGYSREEFAKLSVFDMEAKETPENIQKRMAKIASEGRLDFETLTRTQQGEIRNFHVLSRITEIAGRRLVHSVIRDITEHRKLEAQYLHAQKMESVGTLAGGIAHDFNNILSAIIGYGHVIMIKMNADDPQRENILNILEAAERATYLTKDLLMFSRKQISERKPVDMNEVVRKLEKFLKHIIGEESTCETIYTKHPLVVNADSHQFEQVLMNLATNARDAMPGGGSFVIQLEEVTLQQDFLAAHNYGKPGSYVLVTVSDTGTGMDESTQKRIFEPFYTTKDLGKGTGLGLAVVYGIIKQHDGFINVYSEPDKGTTFRIYLPIIISPTQKQTVALQEEALPHGTETILVAEDDPTIRMLSRKVLTEYGYTVIEAADGEEAVKKFIENKDAVKLLLMDLFMPKMNGKEACDEISRIKPDVKVIFTSGYALGTIRSKTSLEQNAKLICKPVSPLVILRTVRSVLDGKNDQRKEDSYDGGYN